MNNKKPWPTKDAMTQVYAMKLWGNNNSEFYSGEGSHNLELVMPYIEVVTTFLKTFENALVVCDLGCGDFNVGKALVTYSHKYFAIDVVADLIVYNKKNFTEDNLEFRCLDIATDAIPAGDCVLLRQVLQHLSNAEIKIILGKLTKFKYVIITEHIPQGVFIPNIDIISGQGTRLKKGSGLNLLAQPFNFKAISADVLLSLPLGEGKGVIETTLYRLN